MKKTISLFLFGLVLGGGVTTASADQVLDAAGQVLETSGKVAEVGIGLVDTATGGVISKVKGHFDLPPSMRWSPSGKAILDKTDKETGTFRYFDGFMGAEGEYKLHSYVLDNLYGIDNFIEGMKTKYNNGGGMWATDPRSKQAYTFLFNGLKELLWQPVYAAMVAPNQSLREIDAVVAGCNANFPGYCPQIIPYETIYKSVVDDDGHAKFHNPLIKRYYTDESHNVVYDLGNGQYIFELVESYDDLDRNLQRTAVHHMATGFNSTGFTAGDFDLAAEQDDAHRAGLKTFHGWRHRFIWDSNTGILAGVSVDNLFGKAALVNLQLVDEKATPETVLGQLQKWQWSINRRVLTSNANWGKDYCKHGNDAVAEGNPYLKSTSRGPSMLSDAKKASTVPKKDPVYGSSVGASNLICKISASDRRALMGFLSEDLVDGVKKAEKLLPVLKGGAK